MKIVINKCFGGFGLSDAAVDALVGQCEHTTLIEPSTYYGGPGSAYYEANKARLNPDEWKDSYERDLQRFRDGKFAITRFSSGGLVISDNHRADEARTCPALIALIEKMGATANGQHAELAIVEIPDGIKYEIAEYDGREHIAEVHQTWG